MARLSDFTSASSGFFPFAKIVVSSAKTSSCQVDQHHSPVKKSIVLTMSPEGHHGDIEFLRISVFNSSGPNFFQPSRNKILAVLGGLTIKYLTT